MIWRSQDDDNRQASEKASAVAEFWNKSGPKFLPFADAASAQLPLSRLLRLSLFQVSVGMALVLLNGTLNRVMIVELGIQAWLVSLMIALPLVVAPFRALMGFRSDTYRSALGWRRVPYIWVGTMMQYGGLAIMPFALLILSGDSNGPEFVGPLAAAAAFLLVGAGLHMSQTAGLALATDIAPEESRPRVVALLYVMLLLGMVVSALMFGAFLRDFGQIRLIQVIQSCAVITMVLNVFALWKQEPRSRERPRDGTPRGSIREAWNEITRDSKATRILVAVGVGTAAFSMQDILLEPYGGEVLNLSVAGTTVLTAMMAGGSLVGFAIAARQLSRGTDPYALAAIGALIGLVAFSLVIFAGPLAAPNMFRIGTTLIGLGGGLFSVGMLTGAMALAKNGRSGLALGAWGAVQATAAGLAIAFGGAARDFVGELAMSNALGPALAHASTGYMFVYHVELGLLFATVVALGPLVSANGVSEGGNLERRKFGISDLPA